MQHNGPALSFVRVSALFHCPPLNNFTKIKHSQRTTKPRMEFERVLAVVFSKLFYIIFRSQDSQIEPG